MDRIGVARIFLATFLCLTSAYEAARAETYVPASQAFAQIGSHEFGIFPGDVGRIYLARVDPLGLAAGNSRDMALSGGTVADRLKSLIAWAEAGAAGYNAVHHEAAGLPGQPTAMTVREIYDWIAATPGRPHAIGRYQFIPSTLRRLVGEAGIPTDAVFSPALQDRLADILLEEAGLSSFLQGGIGAPAFMDNLSLIWAGLPGSDGRSAYHGFAGNRATITRAEFAGAIAGIFR